MRGPHPGLRRAVPGIQHIAFLTENLLGSLELLGRSPIQRRNVLVDGDAEGYLLQIFTRNLVGPIFVGLIQGWNHPSFGEGNLGALFCSIERDQARRGVFNEP